MTRFERVVLRDCVLREADLVGADLSHATFARSELRDCRCDG